MYDVSVIVPIYNVSHYISRCALSLMEQSLGNIEYIFIDDCTPDNSIDILLSIIDKYPDRRKDIKIIKHEKNLGLPAARNTGLELADGKYIFHCDSDDYLEHDMLAKMFYTAEKFTADIVYSDYYINYEADEVYVPQHSYTTGCEMMKASLQMDLIYNVWNKLVRRNLYAENNIRFPSGHTYGEDMTMILLMANASKVSHISEPLYHYIRTNSNAITKKISRSDLGDLKYNTDIVCDFLFDNKDFNCNEELVAFKIKCKWQLLFSADKSLYDLWNEWYPEVTQYIMTYKSTQTNLRIRLVELLASKRMYRAVYWHYLVFVTLYSLKDKWRCVVR